VTPRRYYLLNRFALRDTGQVGLSSVFRGKQEAEPGTALPAELPSRDTLVAAGYIAVEDLAAGALDGADAEELFRYAGLNRREAQAVIAALGG
jgi:hypothetical protein